MDISKLGSLHLSALELGSVVDDVVSKSTPFLEFLLKYPLVGGGKVTDPDTCGKFKHHCGCLDVATHLTVGYSGVFTRKFHMSCGNLRCPSCYRSWAFKEAGKVAARLNVTSERLHLPIEHLSVSFDGKDFGIGNEKVYRKMMMKASEELGFMNGFSLFHGSRHRRYERINGDPATKYTAFRQFGTDFQPHYHNLSVVLGGYTCRECKRKCFEGCGGFNDRRWQYYKKTGIYVKVIVKDEHKYDVRRSAYFSAYYQLNHSSIDRDAKRAHVGIWMGTCSYRKMGKVKVPKEAGICSICKIAGKKKALDVLIYTGKKNFILNRYDPNYEKDSMQDLYEDGVQVWYIKPKRVWGSPVKNGFTVKFEGGKHG
jgi:hypothetical protein